MEIKEFEDLLDHYGWDMSSWPEPLRQEGNKFVAQNDEAAELIRHLQALEDELASDPLPMGKHKAIDDIFAAIDLAEQADATQKKPHVDATASREDPTKAPFDPIPVYPKAQADTGTGFPEHENGRIGTQGSPFANRHQGARYVPEHSGKRVRLFHQVSSRFSIVAMGLCILFGFVCGVVLTAEQNIQTSAQAREMPVAQIVNQHVYSMVRTTDDNDNDSDDQNVAREEN